MPTLEAPPPITTPRVLKRSTISDFVDKIGIEMEGAWKRYTYVERKCRHTHREECYVQRCVHDCFDSPMESCYVHSCICEEEHRADCANLAYRMRCLSPCYISRCEHVCQIGDCLHPHQCTHSCGHEEDSPEGCITAHLPGFHGDGSVGHFNSPYDLVGELSSPAFDNWADFTDYVKAYHPCRVNYTCGTHMHISTVQDSDYKLLMGKDFYPYFKAEIAKWAVTKPFDEHMAEFWKRFGGRNQYCCANDDRHCNHGGRDYHSPERQAAAEHRDGCRYAHLNYCKKLHGTLEVRLFHGMSDPVLIADAMAKLVEIVDSFLVMKHLEIRLNERLDNALKYMLDYNAEQERLYQARLAKIKQRLADRKRIRETNRRRREAQERMGTAVHAVPPTFVGGGNGPSLFEQAIHELGLD